MYALGAGELFNVNSHSQYVETTIGNSPNTCQKLPYFSINEGVPLFSLALRLPKSRKVVNLSPDKDIREGKPS